MTYTATSTTPTTARMQTIRLTAKQKASLESLQDHSMVYKIGYGTYDTTKLDKIATAEYNRDKGIKKGSVGIRKSLFEKGTRKLDNLTVFQRLQTNQTELKKKLRRVSTVWEDDGTRLVLEHNTDEANAIINEHIGIQYDLLREITPDLIDNYKRRAQAVLGPLYNPDDYEPADVIRTKYYVKVSKRMTPPVGHPLMLRQADAADAFKTALDTMERAAKEPIEALEAHLTKVADRLREMDQFEKAKTGMAAIMRKDLAKHIVDLSATDTPDQIFEAIKDRFFASDAEAIKAGIRKVIKDYKQGGTKEDKRPPLYYDMLSDLSDLAARLPGMAIFKDPKIEEVANRIREEILRGREKAADMDKLTDALKEERYSKYREELASKADSIVEDIKELSSSIEEDARFIGEYDGVSQISIFDEDRDHTSDYM